MAHFSEEQIKELETIFGIKQVSVEILPVRDGRVTKDEKIWWRQDEGPQLVGAASHWVNIREFPSCYSVAKPSGTASFVYADK